MTPKEESTVINRINGHVKIALNNPADHDKALWAIVGIFETLIDLYSGKGDQTADNVIKYAHDEIKRLNG